MTDRESNPRPLGALSGNSTTHLKKSAVMSGTGTEIHRLIYRDICVQRTARRVVRGLCCSHPPAVRRTRPVLLTPPPPPMDVTSRYIHLLSTVPVDQVLDHIQGPMLVCARLPRTPNPGPGHLDVSIQGAIDSRVLPGSYPGSGHLDVSIQGATTMSKPDSGNVTQTGSRTHVLWAACPETVPLA